MAQLKHCTFFLFLKGQGHQTWSKLLDLKQGYNHAKFERPPLNSVRQKAKLKFLSNKKKTRQLSPLKYVPKKKVFFFK